MASPSPTDSLRDLQVPHDDVVGVAEVQARAGQARVGAHADQRLVAVARVLVDRHLQRRRGRGNMAVQEDHARLGRLAAYWRSPPRRARSPAVRRDVAAVGGRRADAAVGVGARRPPRSRPWCRAAPREAPARCRPRCRRRPASRRAESFASPHAAAATSQGGSEGDGRRSGHPANTYVSGGGPAYRGSERPRCMLAARWSSSSPGPLDSSDRTCPSACARAATR